MTRWLALAGLWTTGVAVAQPVTRPDAEACRVTIAYAPEDVRNEIDAWVSAEPRCERELEVRVVPTEDGLYLQARDGNDRVRERVVPDAQSAAVLVVSWMADDSLGPTYTSPAREAPSTAPGTIADAEMPADLGPAGVTVRATARPRSPKWLSLGALGSKDRGGIRGQIDLYSGRRWSIGVGGGWRAEHDGENRVAQARVLFSTGRTFGRLALRVQLGFGVDVPDPDEDDTMETRDSRRDGVFPRAEAGVIAMLPVIGSWGLVGGPLVEKGRHQDKTFSLFLGVQRGL